ncbi:MAG: type III pantothenate kinase [Taibaiella sp.]|jgi:type III pantothenate kinase
MILCLDIGNSQIYGGVFNNDEIQVRFRYNSNLGSTSDQLGVFLRSVLRENDIDSTQIERIAICSVVPHMDYSLRSACVKYFNIEPFLLQAGKKTGLKIQYRNPLEVGSDRIANAIAATHLFPQKNIIIADFGTATTLCAISADKDYLGGVILAGMRLSMEALEKNTAKLRPVEIVMPQAVIGRSTTESIQIGLYHSQLATIRSLSQEIKAQYWPSAESLLIGTGGFAHLFSTEKLFDHILPDLVLQGLRIALKINYQ